MICHAQLERFEERRKDFEALGARIAAISVDPIADSRDFAEALKLGYPLLSDENGETVRAYGVLHAGKQIAVPAVIIVDREGIIRWRRISESVLDRPGEEEILDIIRELKSR